MGETWTVTVPAGLFPAFRHRNYERVLNPSLEGQEFFEQLSVFEFTDGETRKALRPARQYGQLSGAAFFNRGWLERGDTAEIRVCTDLVAANDGLALVIYKSREVPLTAFPDGRISHPTSTSGYDQRVSAGELISRWTKLLEEIAQPTPFDKTPAGRALQAVTVATMIEYPSMTEKPNPFADRKATA